MEHKYFKVQPAGVTIIAVISVFCGIIFFALAIFVRGDISPELKTFFDDTTTAVVMRDIHAIRFKIALSSFILVIGGIGLWRGQAWGWFTAISYAAAFAVVPLIESIGGLIRLDSIASQLPRIVVGGVFFYYLFRNLVVSYFFDLTFVSKIDVYRISIIIVILYISVEFLLDFFIEKNVFHDLNEIISIHNSALRIILFINK